MLYSEKVKGRSEGEVHGCRVKRVLCEGDRWRRVIGG